MPNWCHTCLEMTGPKEEITSIAETQLDFEKILPTPADLIPETHGDYVMTEQQEQENIQKYGHKDWYGWCVDNWGTKWTASDRKMRRLDPQTIHATMNTAWSIPVELLQKLSRDHPNVEIKIADCEEESGAFVGSAIIKNGETVECNIHKPTRRELVKRGMICGDDIT